MSVYHLRIVHFAYAQLSMLGVFANAVNISSYTSKGIRRAVRSRPIEASIQHTRTFASLRQSVLPNHIWKSRFCYHLYYWHITHIYKTHTDRLPYTLMGLLRACHPSHLLSYQRIGQQLIHHTITTIKAAGWLNIYTFAT